jgi:hypothetical protein
MPVPENYLFPALNLAKAFRAKVFRLNTPVESLRIPQTKQDNCYP